MFILFRLSIISVFFTTSVSAYEFIGSSAFTCGPTVLKNYESVSSRGIDRWEYFSISTAADGEFIIENDGIQYPSFTKVKVYGTYTRNEGLHWTSHEKQNGVDVFKLYIKRIDEYLWVKTLMINSESKTYTSRVQKSGIYYKPAMGVCFAFQNF